MCWVSKASNNVENALPMMQVRDEVKFHVGFVLKYVCVNYEDEKDLSLHISYFLVW